MTGKVTNLPDKSVTFDLDAQERPENEVKPPFVAALGGRKITMVDPEELDWRDLITLSEPTDFLRVAISAEDRAFLTKQNIPGWKFTRLLEAYYTHYDLDEKLASARRRGSLG